MVQYHHQIERTGPEELHQVLVCSERNASEYFELCVCVTLSISVAELWLGKGTWGFAAGNCKGFWERKHLAIR